MPSSAFLNSGARDYLFSTKMRLSDLPEAIKINFAKKDSEDKGLEFPDVDSLHNGANTLSKKILNNSRKLIMINLQVIT